MLTHFDGASFVEGSRPWNEKCDVALPCATQNELDQSEAKTLLVKWLYLCSRRSKHAFNTRSDCRI